MGGGYTRGADDPTALIWVSDDGLRWQSVPLFGEAARGVIKAVTTVPDGYVAVGNQCCPDRAAAWTSADGIAWERVPDGPELGSAAMLDVAAGPAGIVAVGCQAVLECGAGQNWRSEDGQAWEAPSAMSVVPLGVAFVDQAFMAVGSAGGVDRQAASATSTDGTSWTLTADQTMPGGLDSVGEFGGAALAAGGSSDPDADANAALLLTSADASTWQAIPSGRFKNGWFEALATSDGLLLLAGWRLKGDRTVPFAVASSDLSRFVPVKFPRRPREAGLVHGAAFTPDGSLAVVVGSTEGPRGSRPAIWTARIGPTSG